MSLVRSAVLRQWVCGALVLVALVLLTAACSSPGAHTVATDLEVLERPVEVRCRLTWPARPTPHVELVQLTGGAVDLVLLWRAAEAELEERRGYEALLEAAARRCLDDG
jgi:hypothetical protein